MLRISWSWVTALLGLFIYGQSQAAITLSSTRIIYEGDKKEAGVTVRNLGTDELLVQSWLDGGPNASSTVPFAVTPPLAHMAGNSRQVLRVLFQGTGVPSDKESVFWLNVQEVPKMAETQNVLQLAIRQRIKLFYRPAGLKGSAQEAPAELTWQWIAQRNGSVLRIHNPTNFHVSMTGLKINDMQFDSSSINSFMIAPGAQHDVAIEKLPKRSGMTVSARAINDYGGKDFYSAPLVEGTFTLTPTKPK